jgi:hypothetical protein
LARICNIGVAAYKIPGWSLAASKINFEGLNMNLSDILNPLKLGFDLIKEWRKKEIIHISPLLAIEKEHIHKKLKEEGYEFC